MPVAVVVGEILDPPTAVDGNRAKRSDLKEWTEQLKVRLHECQARAREMLNE